MKKSNFLYILMVIFCNNDVIVWMDFKFIAALFIFI